MDEASGRAGAQRRADRIRAFREELAELEREGVIGFGPEQKARLDAHLESVLRALAERFDVDITASERQISWGMRIASTIAGAALCAAAVLFFYRVWGVLPVWAQVAILLAAPAAGVAGMEFCSRRGPSRYYTGLLGILACAAALLNLSALAAIFNLPDSPDSFLVWSVFALLLAYAYRLPLLLAGGLVSAIAFLTMTTLRWTGLDWAALDQRMEPLIGAGALVAALPAAARLRQPDEFPWVYRIVGLLTVFSGVAIGGLNGNQSYLPFGSGRVEAMYQGAGFLVAAFVMRYGVRSGQPGVVNLGAGFFALFLYLRLFEWWWDWMPGYVFFFLVGCISLGLLFAFQRVRRRTRGEPSSQERL